jgi:hypothetical protein
VGRHAAPGKQDGKRVESEITLSLHAGQEVAFRVLWALLKPDCAGEYAIAQERTGSVAPESSVVHQVIELAGGYAGVEP